MFSDLTEQEKIDLILKLYQTIEKLEDEILDLKLGFYDFKQDSENEIKNLKLDLWGEGYNFGDDY